MNLTEAQARSPFANGDEGDAWMETWCRYCVHDHELHDDGDGPGCDIVMTAMCHSDRHPDEWTPEPDDGRFFLPSRMICTKFEACDPCGGDPGEAERAERVELVTDYWKGRS